MEQSEWEKEQQRILEPFFNWDSQIEFCRKTDEWKEEGPDRALAAFTYLRRFLGEQFPKNALLQDHAIGDYFVSNVRWTKEWFIWLSECFRALGQSKNFKIVFRRFHSERKEHFLDALTSLHYGLKFQTAGYQVDFEQVSKNSRGKFKYPDLQLTCPNSGAIFFCEISRLTVDPLTDMYGSITERLIHGGLARKKWIRFSGALNKRVNKQEFRWLELAVDELLDRFAEAGVLQELIVPGVVELAIADYLDSGISEWASSKGHEVNGWRLPAIDTFERTKQKIWHKADQASTDHPTILIIKQEDGSFRYAPPTEWMEQLEQKARQCPDVAALIVTTEEFGNMERAILPLSSGFFVQRNERYALASRSMVLFNKDYKNGKLDQQELRRLLINFF